MLFAVRELIGERLQFSLQAQEFSVLPGQILLHLVNLCKTNVQSECVENSPENCLKPDRKALVKHISPQTPLSDADAAIQDEICSLRSDMRTKQWKFQIIPSVIPDLRQIKLANSLN